MKIITQFFIRSWLVILSSLMWMGCESSTSTGTPTTGTTHGTLVSACGFLTKAEVEAIFHKSVLTMKEDTTKYITACTYIGSVETNFFLPTGLTITAFSTPGLTGALGPTQTVPAYFAGLKTITPATDWETVHGIGMEAIWMKKAGKLNFYKGDVAVSIIYRPTGVLVDTSAAAKAGALAAGTDAAARL